MPLKPYEKIVLGFIRWDTRPRNAAEFITLMAATAVILAGIALYAVNEGYSRTFSTLAIGMIIGTLFHNRLRDRLEWRAEENDHEGK